MKNKIQYQKLYKTKCSERASLLLSNKQVLDSYFWENNSCFFVFENGDDCESIIADYLNDKIVIGAKSLFEAIQTIKGIISSSRG